MQMMSFVLLDQCLASPCGHFLGEGHFMKEKARMRFILTLLAGVLPAFIWWVLLARTPLLAFFFRWPATVVAPPRNNFDTQNQMMVNILLFGGLALLWPVLTVIVGYVAQRRRSERPEHLGSPALVLASGFAILALVLLLTTLCGVWLSTFFYFN
jgi:hypothetical protein